MKRWYYALPLVAAATVWGCNPDKSPTAPVAHAHADAIPVTGAGFTSINAPVDAVGGLTQADLCRNGNPNNNCNIYTSKSYVWLNGGPSTASIGNGVYFFAVLAPGGQSDPNDGATDNLSDVSPSSGTGAGDAYTHRMFSVNAGTISYSGSHDFSGNKIRLMPYDDTPNNGGEYIMAICYLGPDAQHLASPPVAASKCKYDAFKVRPAGTVVIAEAPTITKDVSASYDHTFRWGIAKNVDKTKVSAVNGNATFNYTVTVTRTDGGLSNFVVGGNISVTNSNTDNMTATITDALSDGTSCSVTGGASATLAPGENTFAYTCAVSWTAVPNPAVTNTATVTWGAQTLGAGQLDAGSDSFQIAVTSDEHLIDPSVTVTDTYAGTLGSMSNTDASPKAFTYSRTVPIPASGCATYPNTATFTTSTTGTTGSASQSVQACRVPPATGALTMGFWQNKNGQGIITSYCGAPGGLKTFLTSYNPFKDLTATTCAGEAAYVYGIIKDANAGGAAMNAMLKAQMLATALDVYFSSASLGGNRINAPAPVGGVIIDLVHLDAANENVTAAFGGALSLSVSQMLAYAALQSNSGGGTWYAQVKATQGLAKDAFDAINNSIAYQAP